MAMGDIPLYALRGRYWPGLAPSRLEEEWTQMAVLSPRCAHVGAPSRRPAFADALRRLDPADVRQNLFQDITDGAVGRVD